MALTEKLTNIADAIRAKTGESDSLTLDGMVTAIEGISGGGGEIVMYPQGAPAAGDLQYLFARGRFLDHQHIVALDYYNPNAVSCSFMCYYCNLSNISSSDLAKLFDIHTQGLPSNSEYLNLQNTFSYCTFPNNGDLSDFTFKIVNDIKPNLQNCFYNDLNLTRLPELDPSYPNVLGNQGSSNYHANGIFVVCFRLKEIPESWAKLLSGKYYTTSSANANWYSGDYNLQKAFIPLYAWSNTGSVWGNCMYYFIQSGMNNLWSCSDIEWCSSDGYIDCSDTDFKITVAFPASINFKPETLYLGYANPGATASINNYMDATKRVTNTATYEALKNDPEYWTSDIHYSKFNKASLLRMMRKAPDWTRVTSGTAPSFTLTLNKLQGDRTDGGGFSSLTNEEIAEITAKGYTVALT